MLCNCLLCLALYQVAENESTTRVKSCAYSHCWHHFSYLIYRYYKGSNYWDDSNIRSWLYSAAADVGGEWLCGNPLSESIMGNGITPSNPYSQAKGFLANGNFTASERCAIKEVCRKNLLDPLNADSADWDSAEAWNERSRYAPMLGKYNKIWYEYVLDKKFLLDYYQVWEKKQKWESLGTNYYNAAATEAAIINDSHSKYAKKI